MLKYIPLEFHLKFSDFVRWTTSAEIIFRSAIGFHLHKMCCILRDQNSCIDCPINKTCVYSWLFESHIDKDTNSIPGRDKASHPFIMQWSGLVKGEGTLRIVFLGPSINYIPFIIEAVKRTGKKGVSKSRTTFEVVQITHNGLPYEYNMKETESLCSTWPSNKKIGKGRIVFDTPCRIKELGKYISEVDLESFLISIQRRMMVLTELYGQEKYVYEDLSVPKNEVYNQKWKELDYYSSRQKEKLKLGGVIGEIIINENPDEVVQQLIEAAQLFNVGKNVSFGLGRIHYKEEEELAK